MLKCHLQQKISRSLLRIEKFQFFYTSVFISISYADKSNYDFKPFVLASDSINCLLSKQ